MNVMINARHCDIGEGLRERVDSRLRRMARYNRGVAGAEVTFEMNGSEHAAEARVGIDGGAPVIAHGAAHDFEAAFERAAERLVRQLKRKRELRVAHRPGAPAPPPAPPPEPSAGA